MNKRRKQFRFFSFFFWVENFPFRINLFSLSLSLSSELPSAPVDLIITSLEDHFMWDQERSQPWMRNALKWAKSVRSPVLAIDPPNGPDQPLLPFKVCLVPGMPLWQNHAANLFMVNLSVPKKIYKEVGIKYSSPFGAKTVVQISKVTEVTE